MNTVQTLLFSLVLTSTGVVYANNADTTVAAQPPAMPSLAVKQRLQTIERINVTSQKTPAAINDAELQAIIDAAQRLEQQPVQAPNSKSRQSALTSQQ